MDKKDEVILFFANRIRDCNSCPIKQECNECDLELSCDEMGEKVLGEING